jgi:hypothetical protein
MGIEGKAYSQYWDSFQTPVLWSFAYKMTFWRSGQFISMAFLIPQGAEHRISVFDAWIPSMTAGLGTRDGSRRTGGRSAIELGRHAGSLIEHAGGIRKSRWNSSAARRVVRNDCCDQFNADGWNSGSVIECASAQMDQAREWDWINSLSDRKETLAWTSHPGLTEGTHGTLPGNWPPPPSDGQLPSEHPPAFCTPWKWNDQSAKKSFLYANDQSTGVWKESQYWECADAFPSMPIKFEANWLDHETILFLDHKMAGQRVRSAFWSN